MSKSKKNVVDPDDIIASYGADTARFFVLSDSPPERDVIWSEAGVEGAHRFVQRVWRLVSEAAGVLKAVPSRPGTDGEALAVSRAAHRTLKAVQADYDKLAFNKAVARDLRTRQRDRRASRRRRGGQSGSGAWRQPCATPSRSSSHVIAPMMPHFAEECWQAIGGSDLIARAAWPAYDETLVAENEITLPVQINGKKRADLTISRDADQMAIESAVLALEQVQAALAGKAPRKIIVVPQRIVNVVV